MDFLIFIKNNKFILLIVSIFINLVLICVSGYLYYSFINFECICKEEIAVVENDVIEEKTNNYYVEIKGAVKKPGVYEVNSKNIINDVVNLAGGFTKSAYTSNINLSRKVSDELVIYVFTKTEYKNKTEEKETRVEIVQTECECSNYDISNCINNSQSEIITSDKDTVYEEENKEEVSENKLVNINNATKEELLNLFGIGEGKAESIIEYRNINGNFKTIDDIKNVSGIGEALFEKIKNNITV